MVQVVSYKSVQISSGCSLVVLGHVLADTIKIPLHECHHVLHPFFISRSVQTAKASYELRARLN